MTRLRYRRIVWLVLLAGGVITGIFGASALAAEQAQDQPLTRWATVLDPFSLTPVEIDTALPTNPDGEVVSTFSTLGARTIIRIPPRLPERSAFKPDVS